MSERSRGRPKGQKFDDSRYLHAAADLIVAGKARSPRAALRKVYKAHEKALAATGTIDTVVRRWQSRWADSSAEYMGAARTRANPPRVVVRSTSPGYAGGLSAAQQAMSIFETSGHAALLRTVNQLDPFQNSAVRAAMEANERMMKMGNPFYELEKSPSYRMMMGLDESFVAKQFRQAEEMARKFNQPWLL